MRLVDLDKLLPEDVPAGETVLWFGRPRWKSLARRAFHVDLVAAYFMVMAVWAFLTAPVEAGPAAAFAAAGRLVALGALASLLLGVLAYLSARTTLYVITSRRVVMKVGMALPIFFNLPFASIASAGLRTHGDGAGDIALALTPGKRIAYLHLWPHARPFRFSAPEPSLRCVPDAANVAAILARAVASASPGAAASARDDKPARAMPGAVAPA
jgi:hypothetical protein